VHKLSGTSNCNYDCGEFLRGVIDCSNSEDCIAFIAVVSVGWTVVSASVLKDIENRVVVMKV